MMGSNQLPFVTMRLTLTFSFSLILGLGKSFIGISLVRLVSLVEANLARASVFPFFSLKICIMVYSTKLSSNHLTFPRYFIILSSFAWYSDLTWFTINCESLYISNVFAPISFAHLSPASSASYSASLLEA